MSRSSEFIITADTIIKEICRYFRLEEDQIRGQSRSRDCVNARQIAMYLIRRMTSNCPSARPAGSSAAGTTPPSSTPSSRWRKR